MSTESDAFGGGDFGGGATSVGSFEGSISASYDGGSVSATAAGSNADALGGGFSSGGNDTGLGGMSSTIGQDLGTATQLSAGAFSNMLHSGANVIASMVDAAMKNADWNMGYAFSFIGVQPSVVQLDRASGQYSSPPGPNSIVIDVWTNQSASSGDH